MPLPPANLAWPPAQLADITPTMSRWSAWYSGDPAQLEDAYRINRQPLPADRPSQYRRGVLGALARTFWGAPRGDLTQPKSKLHIPLAGDICQASADLLFADPPTITAADTGTQGRLGQLVNDGMLGTLAEAAELGAALGSSYLRVTWDKESQPAGPFFTAVDADGAWPEFRWGRLTAVTFWTVVARDGQTVWRHLERHELAKGGNGVVLHGLYEGRDDNLGRVVPLTETDATRPLATQVSNGNTVDTLTPGLAVTFVPNQRPQRIWRKDPIGRSLGRSDLSGIEGELDALDETYTSWLRDIRLGKARVFAARSLLENNGPGRAASWDMDQEIYAPLETLVLKTDGSLPIQAQQFAIRYAEHEATVNNIIGTALRTAGYSTQTFGIADGQQTSATTATEITSRQQRSWMTRDRKIRHWRPALADAIEKLLAVDRAVFGSQVEPSPPQIAFADGVQDSQLTLAQTVQALRAAEAASDQTIVAMLHPDWDQEQVDREVTLIAAERGATAGPAPDPTVFTGQPPAGSGQ